MGGEVEYIYGVYFKGGIEKYDVTSSCLNTRALCVLCL